MKNLLNLVAALSLSVSCATTAFAQQDNPLPLATDQLVRYGPDIEGWTVYANKTRGDCLIVSSFGPGSVQMGVAADQSVGYLGVFTTLDIGIQNGANEIFVEIGGKLYAGVVTTTTGQLKGGYSGGYILTDDPAFKRAVAKQYTMTVFPQTAGAFVVDLTGTYKAMAAGKKCLAEQAG
ncbi:MAG: hypothetical protein JNK47_15795 [Mesorhizobium sp.]|nr:hypothetical protein [Mesorhizobium sp.]MBL8578687.1 hypothetical protein [Mesorhizobium sp.]